MNDEISGLGDRPDITEVMIDEVPMTVKNGFSSQRRRYTTTPMKERGQRLQWKQEMQLLRSVDGELTSFHIG